MHEAVDPNASPVPAAAGLLALAGLLLGGGGVGAGPPGLAGRLLAYLRERFRGSAAVPEGEPPMPAGGMSTAPRLVPLTVVEDAHERAGRILPPT